MLWLVNTNHPALRARNWCHNHYHHENHWHTPEQVNIHTFLHQLTHLHHRICTLEQALKKARSVCHRWTENLESQLILWFPCWMASNCNFHQAANILDQQFAAEVCDSEQAKTTTKQRVEQHHLGHCISKSPQTWSLTHKSQESSEHLSSVQNPVLIPLYWLVYRESSIGWL